MNTKQISNYAFLTNDNIKNTPIVSHSVSVPYYNKEENKVDFMYQKIGYKKIISNSYIVKFGYCCDPSGIIYPVLIKTTKTIGNYNEFFPSHFGMYEWQQEELKNEVLTNVVATDVWVPYCIIHEDSTKELLDLRFTVDYCTEDY